MPEMPKERYACPIDLFLNYRSLTDSDYRNSRTFHVSMQERAALCITPIQDAAAREAEATAKAES